MSAFSNMMKVWKVFRALVLTLLLVAIGLPVGLYITLSTPWAQRYLCRLASDELSSLMATEVTIDRVEVHPFNRLSVYGARINDDFSRPAANIAQVSAGFDLVYLLTSGKLLIDYALIDGADISLYKATADSPLNIAGILDKLRSKDRKKPPTRFDLRINTVIIRDGCLRYDVKSAPERDGFDPNHICLRGLDLNAYVPLISNDHYTVEIERFGFEETSGFVLDDFTVNADVYTKGIKLSDLIVSLPNSRLEFAPLSLDFDRFEDLPRTIATTPVEVSMLRGSQIWLPDLKPFVAQFENIPVAVDLEMNAAASLSEVSIQQLAVGMRDKSLDIELKGQAKNIRHIDSLTFDVEQLRLVADVSKLTSHLQQLNVAIPSKASAILSRYSGMALTAEASGRVYDAAMKMQLLTDRDKIEIEGRYATNDKFKNVTLDGKVDVEDVDLSRIGGSADLGLLTGTVTVKGAVGSHRVRGTLDADIESFEYKGYQYNDVTAKVNTDGSRATFGVHADDEALRFDLEGDCAYGKDIMLRAQFELDRLMLDRLHLSNKYPGFNLQASGSIDLAGSNADNAAGSVTFNNVAFTGADRRLHLNHLGVELDRTNNFDHLTITSDILNGSISGRLAPGSLPAQLNNMVATVMPTLASSRKAGDAINDFDIDLTIDRTAPIFEFLNSNIRQAATITIGGHVNTANGNADVVVDIPYLLQGDKIIEGTTLIADIDTSDLRSSVYATIKIPTKKGPLVAVVDIIGSLDRFDSTIDWLIDRKIPINGKINFSTLLSRLDDRSMAVDVDFNRSDITFGNDVWTILPAHINYQSGVVTLDDFALSSGNQSLKVAGRAGPASDDILSIELTEVELIEIFETLEIDKAMIGGKASGHLTGSALLSKQPVIETERLAVSDISYNRCVLGDALVKANFDNDKQSFYLDADVTGKDGRHSHIYGDIFAATEALDISFDADRVPVGFMKPFMEAFASDIKGYASGHARLFGTFKYIDMEGDIFADSLQVKIDFTNTWYSATDSIRLRPGLIDIPSATVRDIEGHTARLRGVVHHKFFKEPSFDFAVTDARNFLSYDTDPKVSSDWYGRVYGNGSAFITGEPGVVNIKVSMATAPKSHFTFVLSDQLIADEYSFITFRNKDAGRVADSLARVADVPLLVRELRDRASQQMADVPSAYYMDIQVDITPEAGMTIVMDPVGGDEINAVGAGNLRLTYESLNNDLRMYGIYTLEHGTYNFTLQDIIIKDFTIEQGSSIAFHGDPYNAQLDIKAVYQVNANLSDLDKSFLEDKDLNRTNVPVQALLMVRGEMRQPDISFDLLFPTLNEDIYRKVHSIVSTEEMMNRQIIYLLALNRFYTPDYMESTTKGNEVFAVASSTISSQLSNMLGKLSDKWSIAPNLRSDRGDFTDVEVDVALSSRLLNNRLLLNGNLGYRDKSLNTNQFIGDFDIEYLLNRRGTWRLKAYNRYNDQNYYVRTAATTQGVGVMFKRDFDDLFKFLRRRKKSEEQSAEEAPSDADSTNRKIVNTTDSIDSNL